MNTRAVALLLIATLQALPAAAAYEMAPPCGDIERGCAGDAGNHVFTKPSATGEETAPFLQPENPGEVPAALAAADDDLYDESAAEEGEDGGTEETPQEGDPLEGINRKVFWFNDHLDQYVLEPVARGWDFVAPEKVQECIGNFFDNIRFPVVMVNNLLQGKLVPAASDVGRFAINTTAGLAGFFDPASKVGLVRHDEDFGQTLGVWGAPPGAFLMIPILGPLTIRDGVGYLVDIPLAVYPLFLGFEYTLPARTVDTINWRAQALEQIENAKEASYDYYIFIRDAYLQRREALIRDNEDASDDLYYDEDQEDENADESHSTDD